MRIEPLMKAYKMNRSINAQARYKNNNVKLNEYSRPKNHQYTGNASTDLAYASMYDNKIAQDLKLMGLI